MNSATAGLSSAGKWGSKAARYAVRMGAEVAAETTYDVAVNDSDFGTSLAINAGASLGFDALGVGIGYGARRFANSNLGRSTVAYAAGFAEGAFSRRRRDVYTGSILGGAGDAIEGLAKGRRAGALRRAFANVPVPGHSQIPGDSADEIINSLPLFVRASGIADNTHGVLVVNGRAFKLASGGPNVAAGYAQRLTPRNAAELVAGFTTKNMDHVEGAASSLLRRLIAGGEEISNVQLYINRGQPR